jgi:murein L,D-transpeptidase YafK
MLLDLAAGQGTFITDQNRSPRVRAAREKHKAQIDSLFDSLGIAYPPARILLAGLKNEQKLELWAKDTSTCCLRLVKEYEFTAYCGALGPKRRQGDCQIPEGYYHINCYNPYSIFHLALGINYPNASDRIISDRTRPGGDICIHGAAVTIGCIPIGDEAIEEVYLICIDAKAGGQTNVPVYLFPCRMDSAGMEMLKAVSAQDTTLWQFWQNLKLGHDRFYETHKLLDFLADRQGRYIYED